jgi:hypothetical protein
LDLVSFLLTGIEKAEEGMVVEEELDAIADRNWG